MTTGEYANFFEVLSAEEIASVPPQECFCANYVSDGDLILECGCIIHLPCIVKYIRLKLKDRALIKRGVPCPYGSECDYYKADKYGFASSNFFVTAEFVSNLSHYCNRLIAVSEDDAINKSAANSSPYYYKNFVGDRENISLSVIEVNNFILWSTQSERPDSKEDVTLTLSSSSESIESNVDSIEFVMATTKACPSCNMRLSHFHGHACHHISPATKCTRCESFSCGHVNPGCPNPSCGVSCLAFNNHRFIT